MAEKQKHEDAADSARRVLNRVIEISEREPEKNPAAVELGRLGGLAGGRKGGLARAKKLSKNRREEIAKQAAAARWGNREKESA